MKKIFSLSTDKEGGSIPDELRGTKDKLGSTSIDAEFGLVLLESWKTADSAASPSCPAMCELVDPSDFNDPRMFSITWGFNWVDNSMSVVSGGSEFVLPEGGGVS